MKDWRSQRREPASLMIEVLVNGRFLTQTPTGVQRYALQVLLALNRIPRGDIAFTILAPAGTPRPDGLHTIGFRTGGRLGGHGWEQLELPWLSRGRLLWGLCNTGPLLKRDQVVTIHDASVFEVPASYSAPFRFWYRFLHRTLVRRARAVVTDSAFSRSMLVRHCGPRAAAARVIPLGAEHVRQPSPDPTALTRLGLGGRPYVLAVGSRAWHKNLRLVAQAARLLRQDAEVVAVGGDNGRIFSASGVDGGCRELGYVSDAELRALYEGATCFVHASLHEGFGLPPLEAMACGCPVLASRAASLPEVCGEAALYFDPQDPQDLARSVDRLLVDARKREELRRRGLEQAAAFTWDACARAHLDVIRETLDVH